MKGYYIRPSKITPSVYFNPSKNLLDIRGRSSPENPLDFYNTITDSLELYRKEYKSTLTINLAYEYFNTSTSKCIFMVFKKLNSLDQQGNKVTINWFYEKFDDDMKETGQDLSVFFDMKFNLIAIPEIKALGASKLSNKTAA